MPTQPSITDIRSWYGFVNQVAPFLATVPIMEPFRELLKHPVGKRIYWDAQLEEKMRMAKDTICQLAKDGLAYFERTRPMAVITDWEQGRARISGYCNSTASVCRPTSPSAVGMGGT